MKKLFTLFTATVLMLALAACGSKQPLEEWISTPLPQESNIQSVEEAISLPQENNAQSVEDVPVSDASPEVSELTAGTLNPTTIPGKIRGCFYGNGNHLIVLSDKLYLYDTGKDEILASAPVAVEQISVKKYDGGYLVSGIENGSAVSTVYDDLLNEKERLALSELMSDDFIFEDAVAIAKNGKQLVFAGMRGIYLYDLESKSTSVLQKFEDISNGNGTGISILNHIAFSDNGSDVIFAGLGHSVPVVDGEDGFSIYGYIAVDGSSQQITKKDSYEIDGFSVYGNALMMPQSFTKADGTLLMVDLTTQMEKSFRFSSEQEGKDGVFFSSQGNYVATAVLGDGITIRVYDVDTGELLCDEMIQSTGEDYFFRVPQVMIMDGSKSCIVLMGHTISDMDTATYTFDF